MFLGLSTLTSETFLRQWSSLALSVLLCSVDAVRFYCSLLKSIVGLMVSALDSGASGLGLSPGRGHCVVFFGKTLYSHSASLHPAGETCGGGPCDGLASRPGEVEILPAAASCCKNRDKLRQLWAKLGSKASHFYWQPTPYRFSVVTNWLYKTTVYTVSSFLSKLGSYGGQES